MHISQSHHNFAFVGGTEDGSVNAVPQILYSQYLILGAFGSCIYVLDLKTQSFLLEREPAKDYKTLVQELLQ